MNKTVNANNKMPPGISYIIGNEAAERFSFYGMKTILIVFMTKYLMDSSGQLDPMSEGEAKGYFHLFVTATYFFPIIGALIADIFWGKYKTIMTLSIVYCAGHLALALFENRFGLAAGLMLIAIGSGGIKPCVSSHVGDQFTSINSHLISKTFSIFYFSINFGSFFSTLLTPWLLVAYGPSVAFGIPGILMLIATIVFWMGRNKFIAIEAVGWQKYKRDVFSKEGIQAILKLGVIFLFVAIFWALYDQTGSSWVLQAEHLNRHVDLSFGIFEASWLKFELLASQIQAVNPILVMLFIPLFIYGIYPAISKFWKLTPLRKIGMGFFVTALSFAVVAYTQSQIEAGVEMSILWQVAAYFILTAAEVMISITALEFAYTQAPNSMKSVVMGLFLLSVSLGNLVTAAVNFIILRPDGTERITGAEYFWFFTVLVTVTGVIYIFIARKYQERTYIQDGAVIK